MNERYCQVLWVANNWIHVIDWTTAIGGTVGTAYGIIQTAIPTFGLAPIPILGQIALLGGCVWGIIRLAGFGNE